MKAVLGRRSNGKRCDDDDDDDDDTVRPVGCTSPTVTADLARVRRSGWDVKLGNSVRLVVKMEWLRDSQLYPSGNATPPGVSALSARGKCTGLVVSRVEGELDPLDDMVLQTHVAGRRSVDG